VLFSATDPSEKLLQDYVRRFREDSVCGLDVKAAGKVAPGLLCRERPAPWARAGLRAVVIGAARDCVVDETGVREMAEFAGVEARIVEGAPHDVMLVDGAWQETAGTLLEWLEEA